VPAPYYENDISRTKFACCHQISVIIIDVDLTPSLFDNKHFGSPHDVTFNGSMHMADNLSTG
jgi:hypothetical protein